ncbi:Modification methylase HaeIII [anaerobic digester metagenome]
MGYKVIETFCGPGGLSLGLHWAGFDLLKAFDKNEKAVETHNHNLGNKCYALDASMVNGQSLLDEFSLRTGELALLSGGPPCQGFSKQKRGAHLGDHRNDLILDYIRIVNDIQPKFFLFENVAIFGQKRGREFFGKMKAVFSNYTLYPKFYNCADYGLAQTRERFIVVGKRNDLNVPFSCPKPTVKKWKTVGDVLQGLPEPPEDYSDHPEYPNHQRARVTAINIERFSHVPQGGGWKDIPENLRLPCHQAVDVSRGGWPDVYGRLEWNGQCPTITGGFDSFTRGRYGHPLQNRPLTPREAARLQGFPDSFVFKGTRGDIRSQIGNAVPPPLARAVGEEILRSLKCSDGLIGCESRMQSTNQQLPLLSAI